MSAFDFSSIKSDNPLVNGGRSSISKVDRVSLSFSTLGLKPVEDKKISESAATNRLKERAEFQKRMDACVHELIKDSKEAMDRNSMILSTIERQKVIRAQKMGGEAVYEAVEAFLAASQ